MSLNESIAHEHQGNVVKVQLQTEDPVENTGRIRIEALEHSQPEKKAQEKPERGAEKLRFLCADRDKKRKVYDRDEYILPEINGHVVAHVLPNEVFKEQPDEESIRARTPIPQNSYNDGAKSDRQGGVHYRLCVTRRNPVA